MFLALLLSVPGVGKGAKMGQASVRALWWLGPGAVPGASSSGMGDSKELSARVFLAGTCTPRMP